MILLVEIVGARMTVIIGSLSICLGVLLSAFAQSIYVLYLTLGLIAGKTKPMITCYSLSSLHALTKPGMSIKKL